MHTPGAPLLIADNLIKHYKSRDGHGIARAVDGVSLSLERGETLGIVGESGCGKSTLARMLLRLIEPTSGRIIFDGEDVLALKSRRLRRLRRNMQIVFQDPYASLDPRMSIGQIIAEPLDIHGIGTPPDRRRKVENLLHMVGLDYSAFKRYPHEFSGGQRQRIGIARAIALEPQLLILDEPVSALDVSIQSQILNLLIEIKSRLNLSYIFISHDLSVVEHVSDRVLVMYLGRIVEEGTAAEVLREPRHPYTEALVSAVPGARAEGRIVLKGDPPSPEAVPAGCRFHPRCPKVFDICHTVAPPSIGAAGKARVECHLYSENGCPRGNELLS
jgi:peptide/nickel transport system ATP-binding protein/oligopeptide transport system ATP-binding protein